MNTIERNIHKLELLLEELQGLEMKSLTDNQKNVLKKAYGPNLVVHHDSVMYSEDQILIGNTNNWNYYAGFEYVKEGITELPIGNLYDASYDDRVRRVIDLLIESEEQTDAIEMTPELMKRIAKQVAQAMMAHYENWNVITDGYECGAIEEFSEEEIELAASLSLSDKEVQREILSALEVEFFEYYKGMQCLN